MLRNLNDLQDYSIAATDGEIGHVKDFFFDDEAWVIRYLVVKTGLWLSSRRVLISPISISESRWADPLIPVSITRQQVRDSPDIDSDKPVSRQHETRYLAYYGYPHYWGGIGLWGGYAYPNMMMPGYGGFGSPQAIRAATDDAYAKSLSARELDGDPHLRSCGTVQGYHVSATDGDIGHVKAMIIDDKSWAIRYLVVDTSNWWMGHQVLIAPAWVEDVRWADSKVSVRLTRQAVKDSPPYDSTITLDRGQEIGLHRHYGQPGYWTVEPRLDSDITRD